MLLVSAGFLCVAIAAISALARWGEHHPRQEAADDPHVAIGGSVWGGVKDIVRSPYLVAIALFLFAYSLLSTFLYFQQAELVPKLISDSAERTRLLALADLAVNVLTLTVQLAAFGALIRRLGTGFMLAAMPAFTIAGFAALALSPTLVTLFVFGVVRRAGEYAVSKPARETMFNALSPEEKYKAKNVIDTLVHRTGDTASSWIYSGLKSLGMSMTGISWLSVPISAAWLGVALWLGRAARRREHAARELSFRPA
jgi:AAA family ATP:ADP antiporter